ncbi:MAG: cytochrome c peroxidase, partial [Paracoccaceae bacterium]
HAARQRLYALNRLSNTITIVSTATESVLGEIATGTFDPTPASIRNGRGFLYDARLSGNGTQSCASCHIDGDRDELAWDLGDPAGLMQQVTQPNPLGGPPQTLNMHPMKGPMTTQTLRGITANVPLHWRGDRADFNAFNGAFVALMGGTQITTPDMNAFRDFINTIAFEPNPHQNLDRTMPASFPPGDPNAGNPNAGRNTYLNQPYQPGLTCNSCHTLTPGPFGTNGTNNLIIPAGALQTSQDVKVPQLRNVYQKRFFVRSATAVSLSGFGLVHDGLDPDLFTFLSRPVFGSFAMDTTVKRNLSAFMMCLDTGSAPAVGFTRSIRAANLAGAGPAWTTLQSQAAAGSIDLVIHADIDGERQALLYRSATNDYVSDRSGVGPFTRTQLESRITAGTATLAVMGVPPGSGPRLSIDRNLNSVPDGDEPMPRLDVRLVATVPELAWPAAHASLVLESADSLAPPDWRPLTNARSVVGPVVKVPDPTVLPSRFYRLRKP